MNRVFTTDLVALKRLRRTVDARGVSDDRPRSLMRCAVRRPDAVRASAPLMSATSPRSPRCSRCRRADTSNRAVHGSDLPIPFVLTHSLTSAEVDTDRAELRGARRLRGAAEDIGAPRDLESHEPGSHDRGLELRFQQSAGDSTLPEIDVALGGHRNGFRDEDVADLQTPAGRQDTRHLAEPGELVREEVHDTVRYHDVCPRI